MDGLFVDCNTLWHGAYGFARDHRLANTKPRVDYQLLLKATLGAGAEAADKAAYVARRPNVTVDGFATTLRTIGYEVVQWEQAKVRTARLEMVADILGALDAGVGRIVIATQDPWFVSVLTEIQAAGKAVTVACFQPTPLDFLQSGIQIISLGEDVLYKQNGHGE